MLLEKFDELTDADAAIRMAKAEFWFALNFEMIAQPLDFFERRTGMLYFDSASIEKLKLPILDKFSKSFNWSDAIYKKQLEILDDAVKRVKVFE